MVLTAEPPSTWRRIVERLRSSALTEGGANIEARDSEGLTALFWAAYDGSCVPDMLSLLRMRKAGMDGPHCIERAVRKELPRQICCCGGALMRPSSITMARLPAKGYQASRELPSDVARHSSA